MLIVSQASLPFCVAALLPWMMNGYKRVAVGGVMMVLGFIVVSSAFSVLANPAGNFSWLLSLNGKVFLLRLEAALFGAGLFMAWLSVMRTAAFQLERFQPSRSE